MGFWTEALLIGRIRSGKDSHRLHGRVLTGRQLNRGEKPEDGDERGVTASTTRSGHRRQECLSRISSGVFFWLRYPVDGRTAYIRRVETKGDGWRGTHTHGRRKGRRRNETIVKCHSVGSEQQLAAYYDTRPSRRRNGITMLLRRRIVLCCRW